MSKLSHFIILIVCVFFLSPAMAIEEIKTEAISPFGDFTGDNFFRTNAQLEAERAMQVQNDRTEYYREWRKVNRGLYTSMQTRKTMPPLTKLRVKFAQYQENRQNAKNNKKETIVDSNGIIQDENPVAKEEQTESQITIKCKAMKYLPEQNKVEAIGRVETNFINAQTTIFSDKLVYDNTNNIVEVFDNIEIHKDGNVVHGDYLKIDMNNESALLDNAITEDAYIKISAEHGYMFGDTIIAENGRLQSKYEDLLELRSSGFAEQLAQMIVPEEELDFLIKDIEKNNLYVKTNELNIKATKGHDKIQVKRAKIYNKDGKKLLTLPSLTFYTNKEQDYVEGNYPELGSLPNFGMYVGPGIVLETPMSSTLKLMPILTHRSKLGFGGFARFKSANNLTEGGYNTSVSHLYLRGVQRLDEHLFLRYGANSHLEEWFMGKDWIGYGGDLMYENAYEHNDFLYKDATLRFRHNISAGLLKQNKYNTSNDKYKYYNGMSTFRFRYMGELSQRLLSINHLLNIDEDTEQARLNRDFRVFDLELVAQGAASIYGTGDTQFVGRIGPKIVSQYKLWRQELGYFQSAYNDESPLYYVDQYRYGRSVVYLREYLRLHKYLTLGAYLTYKLSNDLKFDYEFNKESNLREATLYAAIGPDDIKLNLGYDIVRRQTMFGVSLMMKSNESVLDYKKLTIKNASLLGKSDNMTFEQDQSKDEFKAPANPNRTRATVTKLEDKSTIMSGETL